MNIQISFAVTHQIPQLDTLGDKLVASLHTITEALTNLEMTLETELQQISDALANNPTEAEVAAVKERVDTLADRVANIIADEAPPPPPEA